MAAILVNFLADLGIHDLKLFFLNIFGIISLIIV